MTFQLERDDALTEMEILKEKLDKAQYSLSKAHEERENTSKEFEKMLGKYDRSVDAFIFKNPSKRKRLLNFWLPRRGSFTNNEISRSSNLPAPTSNFYADPKTKHKEKSSNQNPKTNERNKSTNEILFVGHRARCIDCRTGSR